MWWLFEKLAENSNEIIYAYSTGNRNLDGRISINPDTKEITIIKPCADDENSKYAKNTAVLKAYRIIELGYPQHEQIACG